jgi:transposase
LVLDNCRIHHSDEVRHLVEEEALCKLVFLPPYSPDYNPIEQAFSAIKAYLRRHFDDKSLTAIVRACQGITPDKAEGYFRASGYIA